jgi:hypothetical protein
MLVDSGLVDDAADVETELTRRGMEACEFVLLGPTTEGGLSDPEDFGSFASPKVAFALIHPIYFYHIQKSLRSRRPRQ